MNLDPRALFRRIQNAVEGIRSSYWFFPVQMAVFSGVIALASVELDRRTSAAWIEQTAWATQFGAEGARSVLSTIAGSMMTVTGVVFSINVVALTLASSQFGPRLLRSFLRDRKSQLALGTFLSTFFYSLLVLRSVAASERVPVVATSGAVLLAAISLFVLIFYIHHAATSIQASNVVAAVANEIRERIPKTFAEGEDDRADASLRALGSEGSGRPICADREGYVRIVGLEELVGIAEENDLLIRLDVAPGTFVPIGSTLARATSTSGGAPAPAPAQTDELDGALEERIRECLLLGDSRTPVQDLGFLTSQLSEMAVRALSPGINDPTTAIGCIHRLGGVLAQLEGRKISSHHHFDAEGVLRVVSAEDGFEEILAGAFDPIRRYGAHDASVVEALLGAVAAGAENRRDERRRRALEAHAHAFRAAFESARSMHSARDAAIVEAAFERTERALAGAGTRSACGPDLRSV
ncbi:MAG: DUF2254 domain-containing protein [Myxococcota bacterium]